MGNLGGGITRVNAAGTTAGGFFLLLSKANYHGREYEHDINPESIGYEARNLGSREWLKSDQLPAVR